ncbi:Aste57867_15306 [Aphanomyces stellatus]|uniref:Aste57867_15306 protein n=1 Tax=Aphanomyces stellatus TaxID=120398 RepID=A0A485L4P4_9STRA|nr:hypothetical protein As57867_015250 [Aphanomyces stellatus]VFT92115.1 Aste57867_15306 [Aphanomyces stellatus]
MNATTRHCCSTVPQHAPWKVQEAKKPTALLDINTCSVEDLQTIPGIGVTLSNRIAQRRPYTSMDQVRFLEGVGPIRMAAIVKYCYLPTTAFAATRRPQAQASRSHMDINTCSIKALQTIPGIGKTLSCRIVHHRPYASLDQVIRLVDGIGHKLVEAIARHCFVTKDTIPTTPPPQSSKATTFKFVKSDEDSKVKADATKTITFNKTGKPCVEIDCSNLRYLPRALDF